MPSNNSLQSAIHLFEKEVDFIQLDSHRKKQLINVTCASNDIGTRAISTINGEANNLIIMPGELDSGNTGAIAFSFVQKDGQFALQVISTLSTFVPDQQTMMGIRFANNEQILSTFSSLPVKVEDTEYTANYLPVSHEDMAHFIQNNLADWQIKNKTTGAVLSYHPGMEAPGILSVEEAQFLFRSTAVAIVRDYLQTVS